MPRVKYVIILNIWKIASSYLRVEILIYFCVKVLGVGYEGIVNSIE